MTRRGIAAVAETRQAPQLRRRGFHLDGGAEGLREGQTVLSEPGEVQLQRLPRTLDCLRPAATGGDTAGHIREVGRPIAHAGFED